MENLNGWRKNWQRIQQQYNAYKLELQNIVKPAFKDAWVVFKVNPSVGTFGEVLHKGHAFNEEYFDKMPRINSYLSYIVVPLAIVGLFTVLNWIW